MLTMKEQAEVCRIGLIAGLLSQRYVTAWADSIIESADTPDSAIIDLSLMGSADIAALVSALFDIGGEADPDKVANAVLGLCADRRALGSLTADETVSALEALAPDMSCRRCNIRAEYATLTDPDTVAAIRTALNQPDIANAINAFLAPYAVYAADFISERA